MTSRTPLLLQPDELVEGRMFAHPDHISSDRSTLCLLVRDVQRRLRSATGAVETWEPSPEQWYRHVIIPRPETFPSHGRLSVVGFFGRRRDTVAIETARAVQDLSTELEGRLSEFTAVLSYTTHLLVDELNYANLVVFESPEAIATWRDIAPHSTAAGPVSRDYYDFVRIYQGTVDAAQMANEGAVRLEKVKYWDYRSDPTWTAHRDLVRR